MLGPPVTLANLSLRQLEVFESVARNLSFTRAARELHLSQPAVSMQIKELELGCQLPLFERLNRGITLTPAGRELARCAQAVAEQVRFTRENLDAQRGVKTGLLTLGAVSTAKYFAPALLAAFQAKYPGVSIRFSVGNRHDMINQLADNRVDLMFMGRPPPELQTVAAPFAKHPLVIVAAPQHRLAGKRRVPLSEMGKEHFLIREDGSGTRAAMEQLFASGDVGYQAAMELSSNETIKQAVMANMGISFLSFHTVGLELQAKRLVVLDVVGLPVVRDWFVIHRAEKRLSPTARAFWEFVLAEAMGLIARGIGSLAPFERRRRRTR
ncbi:MAG: LysR family transcriptional regulator [Deltaproteobacteria bacterium]|jgi:DNA-binding transcriptional LysR family regulator|nr:LysR family transcriptional regulator [Deltaproteobacteria bacterium]